GARWRDSAGSGPSSVSYSVTSSRAAARPAARRAAACAFSVAASASQADTGLPSSGAAALIVSSTSGGTEIDSFRTVMPAIVAPGRNMFLPGAGGWVVGQLPRSGRAVVDWLVGYGWGVGPGEGGRAREEGGEPVAGAGRCGHGDRRREQGGPAGAGDQPRGYHQQGGGQGARDRLALPARPGYVPPLDGDPEGGRGGHDAGREPAVG